MISPFTRFDARQYACGPCAHFFCILAESKRGSKEAHELFAGLDTYLLIAFIRARGEGIGLQIVRALNVVSERIDVFCSTQALNGGKVRSTHNELWFCVFHGFHLLPVLVFLS